MKKLKSAAAFAAACGLLFSGCLPQEEFFETVPTHDRYEGAAYITSECVRKDIVEQAVVNCTYVPVKTVSLSFDVSGLNYDRFFCETGDFVKEGDIICQLDPGTLEKEIEETSRELAEAENSLYYLEECRAVDLRLLELRDAMLSAADRAKDIDALNERYDLEKRNTGDRITLLRLQKETLEGKLAERRLIAPFDGTLGYVLKPEAGEESSRGTKVAILADTSMSLFRAETPYWQSLKEGAEYTVLNRKTGISYEVSVVSEEKLGLTPSEKTPGRNANVYFALKETAPELKEGDSGSFEFVLNERNDVLTVPANALSKINGTDVVYCPDECGERTYREVEVGISDGILTEIVSGLSEGDKVIMK